MIDTATVVLMTDVVGSTRLWETEAEAMATALRQLDDLVERVVTSNGGQVVKERGEGDSHFLLFREVTDALRAGIELHLSVAEHRWPTTEPLRLRAAANAGPALAYDDDVFGPTINRCARLRSAAHPEQLLVPADAAAEVDLTGDGIDLLPLGAVAVRDVGEPIEVLHVWHPRLPRDQPPLRTLDLVPHNLPRTLTSFVGRVAERRLVRECFRGTRLVTLHGPGGAGKSRLAIEGASERMADHPDGVYFVDLTGAHDVDTIAIAVAEAAGLGDEPGRPLLDTVSALGQSGSSCLLVFDNCEHVIEAAAQVAHRILLGGDGVRILATSQLPLEVDGEALVEVGPLALPAADADHDATLRSDAVQLFVSRARLVAPALRLTDEELGAVAEICHLLGGSPLAIELAASRVGTRSLDDLVAQLRTDAVAVGRGPRTAPERQRTLEATVMWALEHVADAQRTVLAGLTTFASTFDASAAAIVAGATAEDLESLWRVSLLSPAGGSRFRMLATVRAIVGRANPDVVARAESAHLAWVRNATTSTAVADLPRAEANERWTALLPECHAAVRRTVDAASAGDVAVVVDVLQDFLLADLRYSELLSLVTAALAVTPSGEAAGVLHVVAARVAVVRQDGVTALSAAEAALAELPATSHARLADARLHLADARFLTGDAAGAVSALEASLDAPLDRPELQGEILLRLARCLLAIGEVDTAVARAEQALELAADLDDHVLMDVSLTAGTALAVAGRPRDALVAFRRALAMAIEGGDLRVEAIASQQVGTAYIELDELDDARTHLLRARALREQAEDAFGVVTADLSLAEVERLAGAHDAAAGLFAACLEEARRLESPVLEAGVWFEWARLDEDRQDRDRARSALDRAASLWDGAGRIRLADEARQRRHALG